MRTAVILSIMVIFIAFPVIEGATTLNNNDIVDYEPCSIAGFDDFYQYYDNESIESFKGYSKISFNFSSDKEYNGDATAEKESYILNLDEMRITEDFEARVTVNYSYTGSRFGQFHFIAGSNYDESGNYTGSPDDDIFNYICYNSIRDPWVGSSGVYVASAYPFNEIDYHDAGYGSLNENGMITYKISRSDGVLECTTLNQENETLITHSWSSGIDRSLSYIIIGGYIYLEGSDTFSIDYTDFVINYINECEDSSCSSISGLYGFEQIINNESIDSFRTNSLLSFDYSEGTGYEGSNDRDSENYVLYLDEWGNISDFQLTVKLSYSYTGSRIGAFYMTAGSYYNEEGLFTGTPRDGNYNNIGFNSIRDPWVSSNGVHGICAYPSDVVDYHDAGYGSLEKNGVVTYFISRKDGFFNCTTVNSEGEVIITNSWSSGINKPLNYITIGGYIYVEGSDTFYANYTDFKLKFCYTKETNSFFQFIYGFYVPFDFLCIFITLPILVFQRKEK